MREVFVGRRAWIIGVTLLAVALVPALAFASHGFEDVPDSNVFHDDIAWMQETGVTKGCNPPENTEYCPHRALIRGEEAAFFHRYDGYLRDSLEPRLLPVACDPGQHAEFDGENWQCATADPLDPGLTAAVGETMTVEASGTIDLTVSCAEGETAIASSINPSNADLEASSEISGGDVTITVVNNGLEPVDVTPYAICAAA